MVTSVQSTGGLPPAPDQTTAQAPATKGRVKAFADAVSGAKGDRTPTTAAAAQRTGPAGTSDNPLDAVQTLNGTPATPATLATDVASVFPGPSARALVEAASKNR